MIKYLSLFSGIGGFEYGIQQSQYGNDAICLYYSEIDKYADSIYRRRFPSETVDGITTHKPLGDVTLIDPTELSDFDLLVAGFPCQSFSIAGKGGGFDDTRGTLFFEIARILSHKRPKYFLLENVRNLLSHNKGQTFKRILEVLSSLGYHVQWQVLNSKDFIPQNRERIFIKGYLGERSGREVLSIGRSDKETDNRKLNPNTIKKLNDKKQAQSIYDISGLSCTLSAHGGGQGGKTGLYKIPKDFKLVNENQLMTTTRNGDAFALCCSIKRRPLKRKTDNYVGEITKVYGSMQKHRSETDGSYVPCLTSAMGTSGGNTPMIQEGTSEAINEFRVRRLTPRECERLQGFPDDWTRWGADGEEISDTQRYKCCGNAVTTKVITHIFNNWDLIV